MHGIKPTTAQARQFRDEGYCVMERVIPDEHLELLRGECQRYIDAIHAEMDKLGVTTLGINHRDSRYFIPNRFQESPRLREFIFSPLMAEICRATIGDNAYLFWEQYVVKCAEKGLPFAWHQDSGYVGYPHRPYLTCWCPLDDVSEENGTVYILPYSRAGTQEMIEHEKDEKLNDLVGYRGPDPGIPVNVPAGSIAVFSSTTLHRSGPNQTNRARRVYLPQYSVEPIMNPRGELKGFAEPFLKNGQIVAGAAHSP
jgi:ectoine hydroxylase-related dioxygenase (phytanoyl-CoA dioxygenase family)